jgi:putative two-component system response regulator
MSPIPQTSSKPVVLAVDDAPENLHALIEVLKGDYNVIVAKAGEKAMTLCRKTPKPDIILLDVVMPEMDGYEVCRQLKEDTNTANIPVIFVTSLSEAGQEAKGLSLGAVDYITKPIIPEIVKARVGNHLDLKRHRDHLEVLVEERTRELALLKEVTIESLATLTECRDPETGGHIMRTKNYVRALATRASKDERFFGRLDPNSIDLLYLSAPVHDIGKVGVSDSIMLKPGKLTPEEFEQMKKHTLYGRDSLLKAERKLGSNSFLHIAQEIACGHHEKWDGSGYPFGLSGEAIPLSARIMALADVYDALISRRVYKAPIPHKKAVKIIVEGKGTHFDPVLVDKFLEITDEFRCIALEYADYEEEREALASE